MLKRLFQLAVTFSVVAAVAAQLPLVAVAQTADEKAADDKAADLQKEIDDALKKLENLSGPGAAPKTAPAAVGLNPSVRGQLFKGLANTGIGPMVLSPLDVARVTAIQQIQQRPLTPQQAAQLRLAQQQKAEQQKAQQLKAQQEKARQEKAQKLKRQQELAQQQQRQQQIAQQKQRQQQLLLQQQKAKKK